MTPTSPESFRWTDLAGGLRVVSDQMPTSRAASFGIFVGVGSRDEPAELAGASHFLEHLTFRGTRNHTGPELAEVFDRHGGDCNAYTTRESTVFHARVPQRVWQAGLSALADVTEIPLLGDEDLEMERQIIIEEYNASQDQPEDLAHELLYRTVFGDTGLGRDVIGTAESITSLSANDIEGWFSRRYRRDRIVVAAAGAVDHDELVAEVSARWQAAGDSQELSSGAQWMPSTRAVLKRDSEQAQLMLAFPGLPFGDDRRFALAIGNQVFGGGLSSRLFQRIREQRGLAYSVYSGAVSFADAGMVVIGGATSAGRVDELEEGLRCEIDEVVRDGISEAELQLAKDAIAGSYEMSFDDVGTRMSQLGATVLHEGRLPDNDGDIKRILDLTRGEVNETFSALIAQADTTVVVGPDTSNH